VSRVLLRLLPGAVLLAAAIVALRSPSLRAIVSPLVPAYPLAVLGGGILLGWRFDRSRLVLSLLVLLLAERSLLIPAPAGDTTGEVPRVVAAMVALLLPLDLAALSWLPERGLWGAGGRISLVLLALQIALVALLCQPLFLPLSATLELLLARPAWLVLPLPALIAFAVALVVLAVRAVMLSAALEGGAVWALIAAWLALAVGRGLDASFYLGTAGLILVISLIETWHGMAYGDELTGLPARRALDEAVGRLRGTYAVAMVDIDHFKRFNDQHGHDVGDQLLRMIGARLGDVSGGGRAFRYGGEEFAVLFPGKNAEEAFGHLEALRRSIEASPFTVRGPGRPLTKPQPVPATRGRRRVAVTVSIGLAGSDGADSSPEDIVHAADQALYRAKHAGRNRVRV
jgi:diguanylate cyclase (GGDEF)-like protein